MSFNLINTSNINGLSLGGNIQPINFNKSLIIYNAADVNYPNGVLGLVDVAANSITTLQSNNGALYYSNDRLISLNHLVADINDSYTNDPSAVLTASNIEVLGYDTNNGYINFSSNQGSSGIGIRYNKSNESIEIKDGSTVLDWATIPDIVASTNYLIDLQDVNTTIQPLLNDQYLIYNSSSNIWINSNFVLLPIVNLSSNICKFNDKFDISILEISSVADAVNYIKITNAITGLDPFISAVGEDSDIGLSINSKGFGDITLEASNGIIYLNGANGVSTSANLDINSTAEASTFSVKPSGSLIFNDTTGNSTIIQPPAIFNSNISLVLPDTAGLSNTVLYNDGGGILTWNAITGNSSTTEILFNNNGTIEGTPVLTSSDTSNLTVASGTWLNFGSSNCNITGDTSNLYITSNFGNIELNGLVIIKPQNDVIITDCTIGSGSTLNITASSLYINMNDPINNNIIYTLIINSLNVRGQILNIFFDNGGTGTNSLYLDFDVNKLGTGSGLARYLVMTTSGQSAQLMYIGGLWRLTGCGCGII
jgi:hypothetical protein